MLNVLHTLMQGSGSILESYNSQKRNLRQIGITYYFLAIRTPQRYSQLLQITDCMDELKPNV